MTGKGMEIETAWKGKSWVIQSPLVGAFNAMNLLAAQAVGLQLGLNCKDMRRLSTFPGVPGRLERVMNDRDLDIFVDYAHTPDALENVQHTLKGLDFKRLITVFGCGGDRDRTKRPLMAESVARYADVVVLTSDNPRTEDPAAIMDDARPGLKRAKRVIENPDREAAIAIAVTEMEPGDALLIAGKGHEDYQIIGHHQAPLLGQGSRAQGHRGSVFVNLTLAEVARCLRRAARRRVRKDRDHRCEDGLPHRDQGRPLLLQSPARISTVTSSPPRPPRAARPPSSPRA